MVNKDYKIMGIKIFPFIAGFGVFILLTSFGIILDLLNSGIIGVATSGFSFIGLFFGGIVWAIVGDE